MNAAQQAAIERARARLQGSTTGGAYDFTEQEERDFTEAQRAALERARARGQSGLSDTDTRGKVRTVADFAGGIVGAVPKAAGGIVSLGSLVPGVNVVADPVAEALMDAGEWVDDALLSDYQKNINAEMAQAIANSARELGPDASIGDHLKNIGSQTGAAAKFVAQNPSQAAMLAGQAIPYLFGGGLLARGTQTAVRGGQALFGAKATGLGAGTAGAVGEGLMAGGAVTGDVVGQLRDEGITEYTADRLVGIPAGAATAVIGRLGAKLGGGLDADTVIANKLSGEAVDLMTDAPKRGLIRRVGVGAATEGTEEFFQSGSEEAFTNLGVGDPLSQDVGSSAVLGAAAGMGVGGVIGGLQRSSNSQTNLSAELTQEELDLQAAQLAEAEKTKELEAEAVRQQGLTRMAAAKSFMPFSKFKSERDAKRNADVLNPQTEIGQAYVEYKLTANKYPANEKEEKALVKKFLKEFIPQDDSEVAIEEFNQALDQHAAAVASGAVTPTMNDKPKPEPAPKPEAAASVEQTQAQDTQEEAAPAKAPKPESERIAAARAYAEEVLGPEWETVGGLSQEFADRRGFYKKGKDGKTTWQRSVDREAAALQETTTPEVDATTEEAPVNALLDNESSSDQDLDQQSETSAASTLPTVLGGFQEEGHKGKALTENQASVATVLRDAFLSNEEDTIQQADGTLNPTIIAEKAGIKNRQAARRAIQSLQKKIADAYGVSVDQVKQRLNETNITSTEAFDQNAPTQELDTAELGEGMGTSASVGQGAYTDVAEEDQAWTQERANEPDQYENKRQEIADKSRVSLNAQMIQQYGKEAIAQWRGLVSDGAVDIKDISKKDLVEWVAAVAENREGQITDEQLGKDQREIERRYATEAIDNEGLGASSAEITEGGDTVEQVRTENTGAPPEGNPDDFTAGENKTAKVETKPKKKLRKKSDPNVSTREQNNRLMPETFKTGEAFVADAYHGTTTDIVEFDNSRLGDNTGAASAAEAFFFAGKGETASSYAESTSPRQQEADFNRSFNVAKKWLSGKTLNAKDQETLSAMLDRSSELDNGKVFVDDLVARTKKNPGTSTQNARKMAQTLRPAKRPQVQMRRIKMDNPLVKDFKGNKFRDETYASLIKKAKAAGHDGVVLLNTYDVAGKRKEDLTDADMDTIFGVFDAKNITNTFKVRKDNTKFGVPAGSFEPASRAAFEQEVKNLTGSATNMRIHVFDTEVDALAAIEEGSVPEPDMPMLKRAKPFGWVVEDENGEPHAHFILDRVPAGREKSAFLHEVGGHVGIDAILEENDRRMIATQIYRWAGQNDRSLESIVARRTISRIGKAADLGAVSEGSIVSEAVAYFLEEAALAGVEPSTNSTVGKFVKKLRDLFLAAFDRLGFNITELTAQDVIDLAYGAAYIELVHSRTDINTQNPVTFSPSMTATENNGEVDPLLANREGETRFGVPESETNNQISWVRNRLGDGAAEALTNLRVLTEKPLDATKNLDRLIRENEEKMPSARKWFDFMLAAEATKNEIFGLVENVINQSRQFTMERQELINDFLGASTFYQKWGYDPQWIDRKTGKPVKVTIDPVMKKKYDRLTAEEQQLVRDVFAHGRTMQDQMQEVAEKLGVSKFFKFDSRLQGPYAPLKRFGNYVGELKSQELLDAEASLASSPTPIKRKKVEELKSDGDHYVISFFESLGAAQTFVNANQDKFAYADAAEKAVTYEEARTGGAQAYEKILGAVNANLAGLDQASKDAMAKLVRDMYFQTLDDSNARLSGTKRLNRAGYDKNMLRAFAEHGMAQANLIAQMKHGGDISTALVGAYKEARKNSGQLMPVYNKIALKFQRTMTPRTGMLTNVETNVMKFNSFYMLTSSLGYFFQNMTQPYFAVAQISGEFGWRQGQTWGKLLSGYGVAKKVINTGFLNQVKNVTSLGLLGGNSTVELDIDQAPPELRPVLKELQLRGVLDVGVTEDLRHVNMSPNFWVRGYDEMTHRLYQSARYVEANNRIASAVAAFKMAQANPQKMKRLKMTPAEFAIRIVQDTQGNFSKLDAPAAFDVLPKAPLQFRKYQFQMGWLHIDAAKQAFKGADPDMKKAGFRKLSLMMGYTGVFGGLASVPMANVASAVIQAVIASLSGDDEENPPRSLERWIRENVEDERTATLLTRGVPAALGWDFSQKLDQSDLFMPYNSKYVQMDPSRDGSLLFAAQLALGPTGTVVGNIGNIADFIDRGNYYRAAEYAMPKGMRSYLETMRFAGQGYETRNGLEITNPTQFDVVDLLTNAIGLPSTDINQIKWTRGQQVEITQWFSKETTRIKRGYLDAHEDRDRSAMAKYRDEFRELQKAKDRVRPFFNNSRSVLKRASVSELLRAPRDRRREQRKLDSVTGN